MFRKLMTSVFAKSLAYGVFFTMVYNLVSYYTNSKVAFTWPLITMDLVLFTLIGYSLRFRPAQKRKEAAQRLEAAQQPEKTAA